MTIKLKISPTLSLPLDFVTSTQAILAKKGSGKSYTGSVQAEELLGAGQQIVVVDPTGAWWGLRSSADGKSSGFAIAVLGGEHADIPLDPSAGEVIADAIAADHFSAVIDLSLFRKGEALRFMAAFLETLYRKNREALHVFIDEADVVAPQKTFGPDEARVLGATEDIVRRGRIRGIGCTLITQRPQVLNKNVLSQVDMLTALRMNHPKDLGAIREWVAVHGDESQAKKMLADLPALPIGEAWMWAPATDLFERVAIRRRTTFDSGRTPKAGERVVVPRVLADVDLAKLGAAIAATVVRVKENDPKALKARVAELEKQLAAKAPVPVSEPVEVQVPTITPAEWKRLDDAVGRVSAIEASLRDDLTAACDELTNVGMVLVDIKATIELSRQLPPKVKAIAPPACVDPTATTPWMALHPQARARQLQSTSPRAASVDLPIGERATLSALIQYPAGLRREQLTVLTTYKRSTRDAYIARLRERGFVDTSGERVTATAEGVVALPDASPLPVGAELQAFWLARLPIGEKACLEHLIREYPGGIERSELDELTGFKRSTRDAYLSRLAAKELVYEAGRGAVKASSTLFGVAS